MKEIKVSRDQLDRIFMYDSWEWDALSRQASPYSPMELAILIVLGVRP
jgi:hypothetical protein